MRKRSLLLWLLLTAGNCFILSLFRCSVCRLRLILNWGIFISARSWWGFFFLLLDGRRVFVLVYSIIRLSLSCEITDFSAVAFWCFTLIEVLRITHRSRCLAFSLWSLFTLWSTTIGWDSRLSDRNRLKFITIVRLSLCLRLRLVFFRYSHLLFATLIITLSNFTEARTSFLIA